MVNKDVYIYKYIMSQKVSRLFYYSLQISRSSCPGLLTVRWNYIASVKFLFRIILQGSVRTDVRWSGCFYAAAMLRICRRYVPNWTEFVSDFWSYGKEKQNFGFVWTRPIIKLFTYSNYRKRCLSCISIRLKCYTLSAKYSEFHKIFFSTDVAKWLC